MRSPINQLGRMNDELEDSVNAALVPPATALNAQQQPVPPDTAATQGSLEAAASDALSSTPVLQLLLTEMLAGQRRLDALVQSLHGSASAPLNGTFQRSVAVATQTGAPVVASHRLPSIREGNDDVSIPGPSTRSAEDDAAAAHIREKRRGKRPLVTHVPGHSAQPRYNHNSSRHFDLANMQHHRSPTTPMSVFADDDDEESENDDLEGTTDPYYESSKDPEFNFHDLRDAPEMQAHGHNDHVPAHPDPAVDAQVRAHLARYHPEAAARLAEDEEDRRQRNAATAPPAHHQRPRTRGRPYHAPRPAQLPYAAAPAPDARALARRDVKVKFDLFHGTYDPDAFILWAQSTEHYLRHCGYAPEEVVDTVSLHFRGAAQTWWYRYVENQRRLGGALPLGWEELYTLMRRKYVPPNYREKMRYDVANATQGKMSPQEFLNHLEDLYSKAGSVVRQATLRDRFVAGLNGDIKNMIELLNLRDLNDVVVSAQRFYEQLQHNPRPYYNSGKPYNPLSSFNSTNRNASSQQPYRNSAPERAPRAPPRPTAGNAPPQRPHQPERARNMECYKCGGRGHMQRDCPNSKKVLFSAATAGYESTEDVSDEEAPLPQRGVPEGSDEELTCAPLDINQGNHLALVTRRVLLGKETTLEDQRETLFHTRCSMKGASLSVIIDGGSCCNIINERVVKHFNLETTPHPQPYGLQWINSNDGNTVSSQCLIPFSIGPYSDSIVCDVVKMDATHLLLGRPWQFDRRVLHDGFLNTYMFNYHGRRVTLLPLSPKEILQDTAERTRQRALDEAAAANTRAKRTETDLRPHRLHATCCFEHFSPYA